MFMPKTDTNEFNLQNFYAIVLKYKWLIAVLMFLSAMIMAVILYFTPSVYASRAVLEIKSKSEPQLPNDILLGALSFGTSGKVEKEIEILKNFTVNEVPIQKTDIAVQYFKTKNYKKIEIYKKSPIAIKNVSIYNHYVTGKEITLHPHKNYFTLSVKNSLKDSLLWFTSPVSYIELNEEKKYHYGETIKNKFFELNIEKKEPFDEEIIFIINGDNQFIFNHNIKAQLGVNQVNPNAPLIQITFEDTIPERADDYIELLIENFIQRNIRTKNEQNSRVLSFVDNQLEKIKSNLEASENKLEKFKADNIVIEPTAQAKKFIQQLSELEIKISENNLRKKLISNLIRYTKTNSNLDAIAPSLVELNDKPTLQLITMLQQLQLKKQNFESEFTSEHPKVVSVSRQIRHIRNKITYNLNTLKSLVLQKNEALQSQKLSYMTKIENLPKEEKNLVNINRDYKVSTTMYDYLLKKKTESELLLASTLSDYKMIEKPYTDVKPVKPKKATLMILAPFIGLIFGIALATILAGINKSITSIVTLEELTDLPLLGVVPELANAKLEVFDKPNSRFTESFRSIRSKILQKSSNEKGEVILLTSTIANEGKTTLTANLAATFQMAQKRVIILNLDLRKPTLHHYFNLENERGLSRYLVGEDTIQDIIFATGYSNLHLIPAGPIPTNPSELLLSNKLPKLLEALRSRYDYIFLDSPPIGLVSDTIPLMHQADQNILVIRENYSEQSFVQSIEDMIKKYNLQNISLVLNRSKSATKAYGYGYTYG